MTGRPRVSVLYRTGSALIRGGFRALRVDLRCIGDEHIPTTGAAVIASNHIGYLDFAFVVLAPPAPRREVRFMARHEFFDKPVVGNLMHRLGQIPVDVHGAPMEGAAAAQAALARGELVGVHPEGTISPSFVPRRAKSGAVRLAEAAGVPIVPCAVWGTQRLLTKGRPARPTLGACVMVRYGEPFVPEGRTGMARSKELMTRINDLLEANQRAYPQRPGPAPHDWWMPAHLGGSAPTVEDAEQAIRQQDEERRARRRSA
jgi:1-acyl-sn-glycerol-3-phosphate acyltransferase